MFSSLACYLEENTYWTGKDITHRKGKFTAKDDEIDSDIKISATYGTSIACKAFETAYNQLIDHKLEYETMKDVCFEGYPYSL